ncbi:MAG: AfsR/SARP family transcriptional regulator, partial [Omnitrophica WOR_2 bacterium]
MARLELFLLGPLVVYLDGKPITAFESNKVRALLAYLAAEVGQPQSRETLAGLLWPDWPDSAALRNLSSALGDLRKNTGDREAQPPFLVIHRDSIQLNPEGDCRVDVSEFNRLLTGFHRLDFVLDKSNLGNLQSAVSLYRGPFLESFSLPDCAPFEEWLTIQREYYQRQILKALRLLAGYYEQMGEFEQALSYAYRQVEIEPWLEEAHQQIMRLLALSGQRSAALAQYETCCKLLKSELGVEPGVETVALYEQIQDGRLARVLPVPEPNRLPSQKPRPNLPLELTRFFGREKEITQVKERLAEGRLVTLTGSGGVGKTRLSLRVIEEVQEDFTDGAWFVEMASLSDPELVVYQVAVSLGLREDPSIPVLDTLKHSLESKVSLLVLDNCEHLLQACAGLADVLLRACPGLKILASSREPLGVAGEAIFRVPSLPFPDRGQALSPESIDRYDSVRLFVDRARQVLPGYQITAQNAASLAAICRRLDGIPLAIELAAARMNLLTVEELANRLDHTFHLLSGGNRTALPRHQTLRATIDWSYNLLNEKERLLLRRLAALAGDWDLAGAEGVSAGAGLDEFEILDLLGSLVNKSMVTALRSQGSQTRYRMLEMIR